MGSNSYSVAASVVSLLRSSLVELSTGDMSVLLGYCTTSLLLLQKNLNIVITDEIESKNVMLETQIVRTMIMNLLERYDDYKTRLQVLNLMLPDNIRRVHETLVGVDHAFVMQRVEPKRKSKCIKTRWGCGPKYGDDLFITTSKVYKDADDSLSITGLMSSTMASARDVELDDIQTSGMI